MARTYPVAERITPLNAASSVACSHCGSPIAVPTWDRWNGFLLRCPHCRGFHGRAWNIRGLALASFLLNAVSFLFTMRPSKAIPVIILWSVTFWLLLPRSERWPDWEQATLFIALFVGPMVINAVLLIRHEVDLDRLPIGVRT